MRNWGFILLFLDEQQLGAATVRSLPKPYCLGKGSMFGTIEPVQRPAPTHPVTPVVADTAQNSRAGGRT